MKRLRFLLVFAALVQLAGAGMMDEMAVRGAYDSLARVPPRLRSKWLAERRVDLPGYFEPRAPDSTGIRMLGKWGRGPSYEVTGRDSLVFLSLGSEVAIINFADPDHPEVLSEPQAMGLVTQAAVSDSFLYIGTLTGAAGIEIWNIEDPSRPVFRNRVLTRLNDFCIRDSFAFVTQRSSSPSRDTFKVYNLANPDNPRLVGTCRDSGQAVTVSGNTVILGDWYNLFTLDVSDPTNPHRVGQYSGFALSIAARGNICCASFTWNTDDDHFRFDVLDISNPASIGRLGYIDSIGGWDLHLDRSLAYISGFSSGGYEFSIVSIADSTHPTYLGGCVTPGFKNGVWADSARSLALVGDHWEGLKVINTDDLGLPFIDTSMLAAGQAEDIAVDGTTACIAEDLDGLKILDVANPASPIELSSLDTAGQGPRTEAVAARDSFAFVAWSTSPTFRAVSITDRLRPQFTGGCNAGNPKDIVLRDSLAYVASFRLFSIVSVARPREPVLVGSCGLPDESGGMSLQDTLAFVPNAPTQVVNVADPANPVVVAQINRYAWNVFVKDTLAFFAGGNGLFTYSVANINAPYLIDSTAWGANVFDVIVLDTLAYVGCRDGVRLLSVTDPREPRLLAFAPTAYLVWRLHYTEPYIYAACSEAGICVFETTQTGVTEHAKMKPRSFPLLAWPNPTTGRLFLLLDGIWESGAALCVRDVAGRTALVPRLRAASGGMYSVDLCELPPGVYFVEVSSGSERKAVEVIKR